MTTTSGSAADFDFLMGTWNCHHRYLVQRLEDVLGSAVRIIWAHY